jgi:hypothetical protein
MRALGVAEAIWSDGFNIHPPSVVRTWHGASPYLDTPDYDGSYGHIGDVFSDPDPASYVGIRVPATSITGPIPAISVKVQAWSETAEVLGTAVLGESGYYAEWGNDPTLPGGSWTDLEVSSEGSDYGLVDVEDFRADLAAGTVQVLVGVGTNVRVSFVQLLVPGDTYVRNHQRDDGLGNNARRNHGATSWQRSNRNHGYR